MAPLKVFGSKYTKAHETHYMCQNTGIYLVLGIYDFAGNHSYRLKQNYSTIRINIYLSLLGMGFKIKKKRPSFEPPRGNFYKLETGQGVKINLFVLTVFPKNSKFQEFY